MKLQSLVAWLTILGAASLAQAAIVDADCTSEGAIVMEGWSWWWEEAETTAYMQISEIQGEGFARVFASFIADTPEDPYAYIIKEVENDTTFAWTDYHINLTLNKTFTIVSVSEPSGWATPAVTQPTEVSPGVWQGAVDYNYGGRARRLRSAAQAHTT